MHRLAPLYLLSLLLTTQPAAAQQRTEPQRTESERTDSERGESRRPAAWQRLFTLPGVEFSADQQAAVDQLREKLTPRLAATEQKRNAIYTRDQLEARREAFRAAREAGHDPQQLRRAVEAAVQLSDAQRKSLAALQRERAELMAEIRRELTRLLTPAQQARVGRRPGQAARRAPTHADVQYGPHARNVMDVWLAESDKAAPLLVSIHGGGFRAGNKSVDGALLEACLAAGISVAAITYRLSGDAIAPAQFHDAARAVQFIRHRADEWNVDPQRIAATGGSAGAGLSLWLGLHDDLADPDHADPILRQSTRLSCMAVYNGQTSYDPRFIRKLFPGTDTYKDSALAQLFDVDLQRLDEVSADKLRLFEEVSALPHLSAGDPPALLCYAARLETPITSRGVGIHHPKFGAALKEEMDKLGIECDVLTGTRRGSDELTAKLMAFFKEHLGVE